MVVAVFETGLLPHSSCYFIDMELCDVVLQAYIDWVSSTDSDFSMLWFSKEPKTKAVSLQIIKKIGDVTHGLGFIHAKKEIHRDLKPHNSEYLCH